MKLNKLSVKIAQKTRNLWKRTYSLYYIYCIGVFFHLVGGIERERPNWILYPYVLKCARFQHFYYDISFLRIRSEGDRDEMMLDVPYDRREIQPNTAKWRFFLPPL